MNHSQTRLRRNALTIAIVAAALALLAIGWGTLASSSAQGLALGGSYKSVEPSSAYPGDTVTFTIVLSNSATSNVAATVIDPSPPGLTFLSSLGPGTLIFNTDRITWTGTITALESVTLTLRAQAPVTMAGGSRITNTAVLSDGVTTLDKSAALSIYARLYMPLTMKRWPPIPYPTTLDAIRNPGYTGNYTVSWQAADLATSYLLQEDDNNSFSSPQEYTVTLLSTTFTDKPGGRYYYRVRSVNVWGVSEWSNIEYTLVGYFFDDFSNPASGWQVAYDPLYTLRYLDNEYSIYVPLDNRGGGNVDTWFDQPAVLAPVNPPSGSPYCVSVDTYFASQPGWWEQHSLIFGASADKQVLYRLETNVNGDWAVAKYRNYHMPYGGIHADNQIIIDWHEETGEHVNKDNGRNHLKVIVSGTTATFYINGHALDFATGLHDLPSLNYVGVIGGSYEVTPVDSRFDNFMWATDISLCP
jgi:uncharacterized repeat protein (TIGR01451 family)